MPKYHIGPLTLAAVTADTWAYRWTKQLMSLVAAKGEKITMNMLGPYCELPRMPMALGHLRQAAQSHTADGILIIAGVWHTLEAQG